jgi:hypothetical protein
MSKGVAALPSQVLFLAKMQRVALDLLHRDLIGTVVLVAGQAGHRLHIGFLRVLAHIPDPHFVPLAQSPHEHDTIRLQDNGQGTT